MVLKAFRVTREVTITEVALVEIKVANYIKGSVLNGVVTQFVEDDENSFTWKEVNRTQEITSVNSAFDDKGNFDVNPFLGVEIKPLAKE